MAIINVVEFYKGTPTADMTHVTADMEFYYATGARPQVGGNTIRPPQKNRTNRLVVTIAENDSY